jgi:hypothetical protein
MSILMPMNTLMGMTGMSIAMNMTISTNMNTNMPIRMIMPRMAMSIKTTMARMIMTIRIMALKRISTSTDGESLSGTERFGRKCDCPDNCRCDVVIGPIAITWTNAMMYFLMPLIFSACPEVNENGRVFYEQAQNKNRGTEIKKQFTALAE